MANWSGLWNGLTSTTVTTEDYALSSGRSPNRYHLMRILRKRGMRNYREVLTTLLEDVSGNEASTAASTYSRIQATADTLSNAQGGARTIETKELMNTSLNNTDVDATGANTARAVAAADTTELQEDMALTGDRIQRNPTDGSGTVTYPADASGKTNIHGEAI